MKGLLNRGDCCTASSMFPYTTIQRDDYTTKWYANGVETGSKLVPWKEEYAYACGAGESFQQAAEEQMYAIAMNNFAKRITSTYYKVRV